MPRGLRKIIVKLRMLYCDLRGHHGKKWNYEPGDNYFDWHAECTGYEKNEKRSTAPLFIC